MDEDSILDAPSFRGLSDTDSEQEAASSTGGAESVFSRGNQQVQTLPRDIWFGRQQLESILAFQVYSEAISNDSDPSFGSKLKAILRNFPYSQCCAYLHANGVGGAYMPNKRTTDHQQTLLSWIAFVTRQGSQKEKDRVHKGVLRYATNASPPAVVLQHGGPPPQSDLARYTSRLKEYADYQHQTPKYVERTISTEPPRFHCRVTFQNVSGEGTGRQKRDAKHQASFNACQQLGLELE